MNIYLIAACIWFSLYLVIKIIGIVIYKNKKFEVQIESLIDIDSISDDFIICIKTNMDAERANDFARGLSCKLRQKDKRGIITSIRLSEELRIIEVPEEKMKELGWIRKDKK